MPSRVTRISRKDSVNPLPTPPVEVSAERRRVIFYAARLVVLVFFFSILFFDRIFQFTLSNPYAIYALTASLVILSLTILYDLIYEEKKSLISLIGNYFFLTLSMVLLFGLLFYFNAIKFDPPGFYYSQPLYLEKDVFYFSAVTYFTIGYGDMVPAGLNAKTLSVFEAFVGNIINLVVLALAFRTLNLNEIERERTALRRVIKHFR